MLAPMSTPAPNRFAALGRVLALSVVAVLCAVAAIVGWNLGRQTPGSATEESVHSDALTDFRLPALSGGSLGPEDYSGRVLLVEFWATWCSPCHAQAKILATLHDDLNGKDVEFLAVNVGEDEETVLDFVEDRPFPYPVVLDSLGTLADAAQIYALPTVVILDRNGEVVFLEPGVTSRRKLLSVIQDAMT